MSSFKKMNSISPHIWEQTIRDREPRFEIVSFQVYDGIDPDSGQLRMGRFATSSVTSQLQRIGALAATGFQAGTGVRVYTSDGINPWFISSKSSIDKPFEVLINYL